MKPALPVISIMTTDDRSPAGTASTTCLGVRPSEVVARARCAGTGVQLVECDFVQLSSSNSRTVVHDVDERFVSNGSHGMSHSERSVLIQAVQRAFDVLFATLRAEEPPTAASLALELDLPRSTTHRMLDALEVCGVVTRLEGGKSFVVTPKLALATAVNRHTARLSDFVVPYLHRLVALTEETASLHVRSGDQRICLEEVEGSRGIRWSRGPGWGAPIWSGAVGRLMLAGASDHELDRILARSELSQLATNTIIDEARLRSLVARARIEGVTSSESEAVTGAAAVAAPIINAHGRTVAVLGLYGPADRLEHMRSFSEDLRDTALEVASAWNDISAVPSELASRHTVGPVN